MPRMNGYDAAREMRRKPWGVRMALVATTGWGQDEDRQRTREAGFDHHLVKPVDNAKLDEIMRALIERSTAEARPPLPKRLVSSYSDGSATARSSESMPRTRTSR
jgi:DNA-binding response OmpR family regulator